MNTLQSTLRSAVLWLVPLALLAALLLWQTFGRAIAGTPEAGADAAPAAPKSLTLALLPEYQPAAIVPVGNDVVERTLFNPTRRPAPSAVVEAAKPKVQRGQFTLSGTLMVDGKASAFLREVQGGKSRRVAQGETINGMVVAEIKADRVRLTTGDESEEVMLKVATGPKTTIQPVMPGAQRGPITATAAPPGAAPPVPGARDVSEVLAERRRAARAAEAAAQGLPPGAPIPGAAAAAASAGVQAPTMPPVPSGDTGTNDSRWQSVYQRYQQPRR